MIIEKADVNKAVTGKVKVNDGKLSLNITSPDATLCLNLAYIKIYMPEDILKTLEADAKTDGDEASNNAPEDKNSISSATIIIVSTVVVVVVAAAVVILIMIKKKKK